MGDINNKNYQLSLMFKDEDMRKPKHDEIMFWLDNWVLDLRNLQSLLRPYDLSRRENTSFTLDAASLENLTGYEHASFVRSQFEKQFEKQSIEVKDRWPDEPPLTIKFINRTWEPWLHAVSSYEKRGHLGCCDMVASYSLPIGLNRQVSRFKTLRSLEPETKGKYPFTHKWAFEDSNTPDQVKFTPNSASLRLYFEAKSEIRSVGELMRQLNLYKSSYELQGEDFTKLIVVAPPNEDAAKVVRSHGYGFVEYRP